MFFGARIKKPRKQRTPKTVTLVIRVAGTILASHRVKGDIVGVEGSFTILEHNGKRRKIKTECISCC